MIVVSDAGPLRYLVLIDRIEFLPSLFGSIVVPDVVLAELRHPLAPVEVRRWAGTLPSWASLRSAIDPRRDLALDPGENAAIALLLQEGGVLLADDREAVLAARRLGFRASGTLGVLLDAHRAGLGDLGDALTALAQTNFRTTEALLSSVWKLAYGT